MENNFWTQADIDNAHAQAAIYAKKTQLTADDLYSLWADACVADEHAYDPRPIYDAALRRYPLADHFFDANKMIGESSGNPG